ncbi:uncharacterized protein SPAPADRAFT_58030 [Spathaspora passalidarum NRRL Y-27907]|uniref:Uncharacterized protein n=1 Tax=Spathaspora passalidarum (strain NRRL Y-27907 / 11-Y1) TaxID=619300 RepID=G3AFB6_SPAPN|nr:uncharacterized protein SPAPADRAFT_58030 [Spathaspora passalidarum NRRL Y-27907]EGW34905.1 hypothetical protein SPAPADRAFT_58030 [Spathaspora passalidarum NRRL Y-27907]
MGRHLKRQKIATISRDATSNQYNKVNDPNIIPPSFPPTKYEQSPATLKNFPSSIINGVTLEGGLYSLTFKSIACVDFVENNDLMRRSFRGSEIELSRITEKEVDLKGMIDDLKSDITKEKEEGNIIANDPITELSKDLQNRLEHKLELTDLNPILKQHKVLEEDKVLIAGIEQYHRVSGVNVPAIDINKTQVSSETKQTEEIVESKQPEQIEQQPQAVQPTEVVETSQQIVKEVENQI